MIMRSRKRPGVSLVAAAVLAASIALSGGVVAQDAAGQRADSTVPESQIAARRAKHDPVLNMLTYQHMDEFFGTQPVSAGAPSPLPIGTAWAADQFKIEMDGTTYSMDAALERMRINSIVVMRDGELVYENYRNGTNENTRSIIYSASKSVTAILVGIAVEKGLIDSIDDPVDKYLPELADSAYAGVPIKHLMAMQSGNSWQEIYTEGSELYIHRDRSLNLQEVQYEDYALTVEKIGPSGEVFNYSTLDTNIVGWLLDKTVGGKFSEFMSENLWTPSGMEADAYWVEAGPVSDPRPFYGAGLATTTRDLARIGEMMLNGGRINGNQIISEEWARTISSPQGGLTHYGYFWWMMPNGAYAALGVAGQAVYVDPTSRTVVAINSYWPELVSTDWSEPRDQFVASINAMDGAK